MKKVLLILGIVLASMSSAFAQKYIVEITPDKKVIYLDLLGLPDYVSVSEVLQMFPEFLAHGDQLFNSFDIQYDGKSVGESRDVFLVHTRIDEIEKVEISTSSVATQQNSSLSGTINFVPRKLEKGFGGEAFINASTISDVMAGSYLNYVNDKVRLKGYVNLEGYWPGSVEFVEDHRPGEIVIGTDRRRTDYQQETARVDFEYRISEKDKIKAWLIESAKNQHDETLSERLHSVDGTESVGPGWTYNYTDSDTTGAGTKAMYLRATVEYQHEFFEDSKFTAVAGYEFNPRSQNSSNSRQSSTDAEVKYSRPLWLDESGRLTFETGAQMTLNQMRASNSNGRSTYASPFADFKFKSGLWSVNAGVRYQYFERHFSLLNANPYASTEHDIVANINALWQFKPHQALKFVASRNLTRPTDQMLYPGMHFNVADNEWVRGNRDLGRTYFNTAGIEYITDWNRDGHSIIFNTGLSFIHVDGLVETQVKYTAENSSDGMIKYHTFANTGSSNVGTINMSLMYRYGLFTLSAAGNVYAKAAYGGNGKVLSTYYNFNISPIFNFKKDWTLTGRFIYNSPVSHQYSILGDCLLALLRVSKRYANWTFSFEISDIFEYETTDRMINENGFTLITYDMYGRYLGLGVNYKFGRGGSPKR